MSNYSSLRILLKLEAVTPLKAKFANKTVYVLPIPREVSGLETAHHAGTRFDYHFEASPFILVVLILLTIKE